MPKYRGNFVTNPYNGKTYRVPDGVEYWTFKRLSDEFNFLDHDETLDSYIETITVKCYKLWN